MSDAQSYPNARDCEHGHQRGHCPYCELAEFQRERDDYEQQVRALKSPEYWMENDKLKSDLAAKTAELEEAKEDLAVARSQVENADATLEQMRLVDKRNLAAANERINELKAAMVEMMGWISYMRPQGTKDKWLAVLKKKNQP